MTDSIADRTVQAFNADHVIRLTGLSRAQLRYWDATKFFKPEYAVTNTRDPFSRIYSFQNVVGLRTLGLLRRVHGVPLQHLRKVARELAKFRNAPWSDIALHVLGKQVYFKEPATGKIQSVIGKQYALIELKTIMHDVAAEANKLRERSPTQFGQVERHRHVVHNAWVVAGTRIPTRAIQRYHDAGFSPRRIVEEYPVLTERDVSAALHHEAAYKKRA